MVPWWEERGYLAWYEGRERFQLSVAVVEPRFLWNIYVEYVWCSKGYFKWVDV